MSFYINWQKGDTVLRGVDGGQFVDNKLVYPIGFPAGTTDAQLISLRSSARDTHTFERLTNLRLYLTGSDVSIVQESWPYLGNTFSPARPELNGGFLISFDGGRNYITFDKTHGYESDPTTWIQVPALAIGLNGIDGVLGAFDDAQFLVRYKIPSLASSFKVLDIQLVPDFDIQ